MIERRVPNEVDPKKMLAETNLFWMSISETIDALKQVELLISGEPTIDVANNQIALLKKELESLGCIITNTTVWPITEVNQSVLEYGHKPYHILIKLSPNLLIEDQSEEVTILLLQELFRQRTLALYIMEKLGLQKFPQSQIFPQLPLESFTDALTNVKEDFDGRLDAIDFPL